MIINIVEFLFMYMHFYTSANVVVRGIMFPECSCMRAFVQNKHC